jgi:hypothetical protein
MARRRICDHLHEGVRLSAAALSGAAETGYPAGVSYVGLMSRAVLPAARQHCF